MGSQVQKVRSESQVEKNHVEDDTVNMMVMEQLEDNKSDIDMTNVVHPKEEQENNLPLNRFSYRRSTKTSSTFHYDGISNDSGVYDEICEADIEREMEELKKKVV